MYCILNVALKLCGMLSIHVEIIANQIWNTQENGLEMSRCYFLIVFMYIELGGISTKIIIFGSTIREKHMPLCALNLEYNINFNKWLNGIKHNVYELKYFLGKGSYQNMSSIYFFLFLFFPL